MPGETILYQMERLQPVPTAGVDFSQMTSAGLVAVLNQSQKAMHKLLSTCLGHYGLNITEWTFLSFLAEAPKTPTELAKRMDVKTPYVALLIRQMKVNKPNLFALSTKVHDTRSKTITLTSEGLTYVAGIEQKLQACLQRELAQKIAAPDLATYFTVTDFIATNVKHHEM